MKSQSDHDLSPWSFMASLLAQPFIAAALPWRGGKACPAEPEAAPRATAESAV